MTQLYSIYPSYVLHKESDVFSSEENSELTKLAWRTWLQNESTESQYQGHSSSDYYTARERANFFVQHREWPVVKKFAYEVDAFAREYLKVVYKFECTDPIDLMAEPFCQNKDVGTFGIMPHTHVLKPLVITYYSSVKIDLRDSTGVGGVGVNGEANFYDPSGVGKRPWPNNNRDFHNGAVFRLQVKEGTWLAFEGYLPHDSSGFEGLERVVIPVLCYPKLKNKNLGQSIQNIWG